MAKSIAIVAGSYHKESVEKMVEKAKAIASDNNLIVEEVNWVPGSATVASVTSSVSSTATGRIFISIFKSF